MPDLFADARAAAATAPLAVNRRQAELLLGLLSDWQRPHCSPDAANLRGQLRAALEALPPRPPAPDDVQAAACSHCRGSGYDPDEEVPGPLGKLAPEDCCPVCMGQGRL